ncbi:MAG: NAD(P)/FAD-dependent oxidoreductase [Deltaproteobacteria bacterium]|nr:NAD(P)/FAD-dependent oxidoreductase [Deltaproteobacteria bacterium]
MGISRRNVLKGAALAAGGGFLLNPGVLRAKTGSLLPASKGNRVVIVGGGWAGVTTARNLLQANSKAEVVLIEKNALFMSCPMSNLFIGGMMSLNELQFEYSNVAAQGVEVIHETVLGVDRDKRVLETSGGSIAYDYLVLAPGIDYKWESVQGLWEARNHIPIAFKPGAEHVMLKRQLDNFEDGNLVVGIPKGPIRCPPGPYERVAMLAHHLKKNKLKAKLIVLDANPKPMAKPDGFLNAYKELYGDIVEYVGGSAVESVDHNKKVIRHSVGEVKYAMANIIPEMKAGALVELAGVNEGAWAPINSKTFQSTKDARVFIAGDAIGGQPFPKSGFMANSIGKALARQVAAIMTGKDPSVPSMSNICYSTVEGTTAPVGLAIDVAHAFEYVAAENKWNAKSTSRQERTADIAKSGREWARGIWFELFGDHG